MSLLFFAFESNANLPDLAAREDGWEVESLIVSEVLLVWNHGTISGSRLLRLLLLPTEHLHLLIGLCGLWTKDRWENITAHLKLLRRWSSIVGIEGIEFLFLWPDSIMIWRFDNQHPTTVLQLLPWCIINLRKISRFAEIFHHATELAYAEISIFEPHWFVWLRKMKKKNVAGRVEFNAVKSEGIKSIILGGLVHPSKF